MIGKTCKAKIKIKEEFNNVEYGNWEGRYIKDIAEQYPKEWGLLSNNPEELRIENMETLHDVQKRAKICLDNLVSEHAGEPLNKPRIR